MSRHNTCEARRTRAVESLERAERVLEDADCRATDGRQTVNDLRARLRDSALSPRQRAALVVNLRRSEADLQQALHDRLLARQTWRRAAHQLSVEA